MKTWHWRPCIWSDWEKKMMLQICFNGNLSHRHISPMSTILSVNRFISHSTLWENFQSQSLFGVGDFDAGCLQLWSDGERERGRGALSVLSAVKSVLSSLREQERGERSRSGEISRDGYQSQTAIQGPAGGNAKQTHCLEAKGQGNRL